LIPFSRVFILQYLHGYSGPGCILLRLTTALSRTGFITIVDP